MLGRAASAEVLGLLGAVDAVEDLLAHVHPVEDDEVRMRCARALGRIGTPRALLPLTRLVSPTEPPGVRAVAVQSLGRLGGRPTITALIPRLDDVDHRVARNAATALMVLGTSGLDALRDRAARAIEGGSSPVRRWPERRPRAGSTSPPSSAPGGDRAAMRGGRAGSTKPGPPSMSRVGMTLAAIVWAGIAVLWPRVSAAQLRVVVSGGRALAAATRRHGSVDDDAAMASPLTPPVSIVLPWYEDDAIERLHGGAGAALSRGRDHRGERARGRDGPAAGVFGLVEIPVVLPTDLPSRVEVTAAAIPRDGSGLLVVEVRGPANSADLVNVGAGLARDRPGVRVPPRRGADRRHAPAPGPSLPRPTARHPGRDDDRPTARHWGRAPPPRRRPALARRMGRPVRPRRQLRSAVLRHAAGLDNGAITEAGGLLLIRRDQAQEVGGFRPRLGAEDDDLRVRATRLQGQLAGRRRRVTPVAVPVSWRTPLRRGATPGSTAGATVRPRRTDALSAPWRSAGLVGVLGVGLGLLEWPLLALVVVVGVLIPATIALAAVTVDDLAFPKHGSSFDLLAASAPHWSSRSDWAGPGLRANLGQRLVSLPTSR